MPIARRGLLIGLAFALLATPAIAQDQRFALSFGLVMVEPSADRFDNLGGFEVDFRWRIRVFPDSS
jgi:hypothetical protein